MVVTGIASYSIYLVHLPVLGGLERRGVESWPATVIALGVGFAFWWLVERPFLQPTIRGQDRDGARRVMLRLKWEPRVVPAGRSRPLERPNRSA
jgi:peptidoglycan/LPS O-acetylase OafA/YrhL